MLDARIFLSEQEDRTIRMLQKQFTITDWDIWYKKVADCQSNTN